MRITESITFYFPLVKNSYEGNEKEKRRARQPRGARLGFEREGLCFEWRNGSDGAGWPTFGCAGKFRDAAFRSPRCLTWYARAGQQRIRTPTLVPRVCLLRSACGEQDWVRTGLPGTTVLQLEASAAVHRGH
ncbi:hypothetical protein MRX96_015353 [Rhipicephalus microplus]